MLCSQLAVNVFTRAALPSNSIPSLQNFLKMGLMICADCGFEHSESAPACPKCGRPNNPPTTSVSNTVPAAQPAIQSSTVSVRNEGCASGCGRWIIILFIGVPIGIFLISVFLPSLTDNEEKNRESAAKSTNAFVESISRSAAVHLIDDGSIIL